MKIPPSSSVTAVLAALFVAAPSQAATLSERLSGLIGGHEGKVAVSIKHLGTGESFEHNPDVPMPTASLIKFPVMIEAYRQAEAGQLDLKAMNTLKDADKVPGSGILTTHFTEGMTLSNRDAIRLMIAYSDNTATNLVVDRIGLPATAKLMEEMGLPNTKLHSKVYRRDTSIFPERSKEFGLGSTTAGEMMKLLEKLHKKELIGEAASKAMLEHMYACEDKSQMVRLLPYGTKVAQKTGAVSDVRTSAGIIDTPGGPIAICVLTAQNKDQRWVPDNAAEVLVAEIARETYNHFQKADSLKAGDLNPGSLKIGASGDEVVRLQKLLNAKLAPPPGLALDGSFGPGTQSAVVAFQKQAKLEVNGVAGDDVWKALGELPPGSGEAPSPESVNAEVATKAAPDPLDGPPLVTADAWIIADAETGERVDGLRDGEPLPMASTTKIMTAYLVLREASKDPAVLDEVVTFSRRADGTIGSTSGVEAGERLTVRELLYGLLLPSGNDAAVAFAEHFGHRLAAKVEGAHQADPLDGFVDAMNAAAKELGLSASHYTDPHGLGSEGHHSSAGDLAALTRAALALPGFAEYVKTSKRGCRVLDADGKPRNLVWGNTNQLLGIDGFAGIKTGTTGPAGPCLVALGRRDGRSLIVVTLHSANNEARYVDTRNLFRWGWSRPGAKGKG